MIENKKYNIVNAALLSALMMLIIMLPSMLQYKGIFIIRGDYVDQYLPRLIRAKEILSTGNGTWDWFNFLGVSYNKTSLFFSLNSISLLFPSDLIPYVVTYLHLIRIAIISISAFCYFKYMVRESKIAFLGAILYTFSSYTFINLEFMQFIDSLWTFPFLLLSVEKMFRDKNYKHQLILASFFSCTVSSYFFIFSAILFSLYFLCRFFLSEEWREKRKVKYFLIAVLEYVLGFLCAIFIFASFFYKIFNSSGSAGNIGKDINLFKLVYDRGFISRVFALFVPAASNRFSSFGYSTLASRAAYVPLFGVSFVIAYIASKNSKKWLKVLCITGTLGFLIPILMRAINLFSSTYTRYSYGIILFFILTTLMFLDNYEEKIARKSAIFTVACITLMTAMFFIVTSTAPEELIEIHLHGFSYEQDTEYYFRIFTLIFAFIGYALLFSIVYSKKIRSLVVPVVSVFIVIYGCFYTSLNLTDNHLLDYYRETKIDLNEQVAKYFFEKPESNDTEAHRIDASKQCRNYAYTMKKPSISIFESVRQPHTDVLAKYIGINTGKVNVFVETQDNSTRTLLGVKYYYDIYPDDNLPVPKGFSYLKTEHGIDIYQNDNFIGMGFSYDSFITRSEFDEICDDENNNADFLMNTLVVEDSDVPFISDILKPYDTEYESKGRKSLENFKINSEGFTAEFNSPSEEIVFVSVPYEKEGWTLTINGKESKFIKANISCIAFKTESGKNEISLSYKLPYLSIGIYGSCFGLILTLAYILIYKKIKNKDKR